MKYKHPEALVTSDWLAKNIGSPKIAIVDASFYLPDAQRNPGTEFAVSHIPGAIFFDINAIANLNTNLPHMLPSADKFSSNMRSLGISCEQHVICYDTNGGPMAAMRAWWTFRIFGHEHVSVLSGGLPKWYAEGRETASGIPSNTESSYLAEFNPNLVQNIDQILKNVASQKIQMVDARSEGRFNGTEVEPRAGIRSGHIPGAINLPFQRLLDMENYMIMRSADEITAVITSAGIDPEKPLISSCGSGVTAAPLVLALYLLGHTQAAIYDGSWTEWGGRDDTPIDM